MASRKSTSARGGAGALAVKKRAKGPALDVVCFGETLWDIYESKPTRGEPMGRDFYRALGGAPANVATDLARLGVRSAVVGGVGEDRFGAALAHHLARDGVDTRFLIHLPNRTGLTFVSRDARGEPSFLFYRHDSADMAVRAEHVTPEMGEATWALVGTSTMMRPDLAAATRRFLDVAAAAGAHLVVDLNVRAHLWSDKDAMREAVASLVRGAAIVKGSFDDLIALTGRRDILWLADHAPKAAWIITQGAKGASAIGDHGFVARPALRTKCVDATGAGDAFIAGALATLLAAHATPGTAAWKDEQVWTSALEVGHMLGAKAVSGVGSVSGIVGLGPVRARIKAAAASAERAASRTRAASTSSTRRKPRA